jgi:hypothetical protein
LFVDVGAPADYGKTWWASWNVDLHHTVYAQDRWSPTGRVTVTAGARLDYQDVSYKDGIRRPVITDGVFPPTSTVPAADLVRRSDVAARLGVSYDLLTGHHKTALKAFYGRYYNNFADSFTAANPGGANLAEYNFNDQNRNGRYDGPQELGSLRFRQGGASASVNPDLRTPFVEEWSVTLERQFWDESSARFTGYRMIGQAPGERSERDLSWLRPLPGDLSADGRTVLFDVSAYKMGGGNGIYLRKTDGSTPVRLEGGYGDALALSPDGQWAVVSSSDMPAKLELLPTRAGEARVLPGGGIADIDRPVRWFPDGKRILFRGRVPGHRPRSFVQDVEGRAPVPLTPEGIEGVAISPDGKLIATDGADQSARPAIYSMADESLRPIPGTNDGDRPIQWSADGRVLYVRAPGMFPANVSRVDIATGHRELWKTFAPPDRAGLLNVDPILVTPDGRGYVYRYRFDLSDLYLVEGIK